MKLTSTTSAGAVGLLLLLASAIAPSLAACGGGGGGAGGDGGADMTPTPTPTPAAMFSVGGTVSGLTGTGLVLQNNAGDDIPIAASGSFHFPMKLTSGAAYTVMVKTQPTAPKQTCTVSGGTGAVASGDVTGVMINCATDTFTVGGTVTGLVGSGLTLQNNSGNDLIQNANGTFAFSAPIASGASYAVTIKTQPGTPSQTCTVTSATGTVAAANISNIAIACTTNKYTVGGMVAGLSGTGLTLQNNGGDTLTVTASGAFMFPTSIASGAAFAVTVSAQPTSPSQMCVVTGDTGMVGAANVTSVAVNCTTNKYTIGGTATGLLGTAVLQNNAGDDLNVTSNGAFAFATPIASGANYVVTVKTQPGVPSQTCTLTNAAGTVAAAGVTTVALDCVTNKFKVKGTVKGLAGAGLVLQNNSQDDLGPIAANGAFEFATTVASGQTYAVTVKTQPTGLSQTCTVTNPNGTIGAADVTNVAVDCVTNSYTVGGAIAGLTGSGLVLQDNLGDDLAVPAGGAQFTFATKVVSGGGYSITVKTQPATPSQTCSVSAGSGTVTNGNIVTVNVNCTTNKYVVGGTVSGLVGTGLVLQNNAGDDLTINGNGPFAFATPLLSGTDYAVTVKTQPTVPSQTCTPTFNTGKVGGANVTTVAITCITNTYSIGGNVSGMTGGSLVLQDNGGNNLNIGANGAFVFTTKIASGASYAVTVPTQPVNQYCTVSNGSGTVGGANVTSVAVACVTSAFPSTGAEGAFAPTANTVLAPGVHNYTTINIPAGVMVTTSGSGLLDLRAQGDIVIAGTIDVSGGAGANGITASSCWGGMGGGGVSGAPTAGTSSGGACPAAATGGAGGPGVNAASGARCTAIGGVNGGGSGGGICSGGAGGGGFAGGGGGGGTGGWAGGNGGAAGAAVAGTGGAASTNGSAGAGGTGGVAPGVYLGAAGAGGGVSCGSWGGGGGGGGSIGAPAAADLAAATTFQGGSAGGGGGGNCIDCGSAAGGGGGGGGGALRLSTIGKLTVSGTLRANGGNGGTVMSANGSGGGGGGSGGLLFLYAPTMDVRGTVSAVGGAGGGSSGCNEDGGSGGLGRIRISVNASTCALGGTFNPPLAAGCGPANTAGKAYVAGYPN